MSYYTRYNLETDPFQKQIRVPIYESIDYKEVHYRLDNLLIRNGFGLIMGAPGTGKTTTVRTWTNMLNKQSHKIVYLTLSTVSVADFFRQLAFELGNEPKYRKSDNFNEIRNAIRNYVIEQKKKVVIIIDEAHQLRSQTISDLKMLFNFDMDSNNMVTVILIGHRTAASAASAPATAPAVLPAARRQSSSKTPTNTEYFHPFDQAGGRERLLQMLFNFDMDSNNMVTVILIGHQSIVQMLNSISNEAMRQRITMNYTFGPLDNETCKEYIKKKLVDAGCHLELFTPNALDSIHSYSNGTPRIIDSICSAA